MVFSLFNGSYIGKRNTGIGVVAKSLAFSLSSDLVGLLDPIRSGRNGSIDIQSNDSKKITLTLFPLPDTIRSSLVK